MFLAVSLALPLYSMAQTPPKLTLESYTTGDRITGAPIKSFSMGTDGSLVVYLDGPFTFTLLVPDISVDGTSGTYSGCTVSPPTSVTVTPGANLSFKLVSKTPNTIFSPIVVDPDPGFTSFTPSTGVFTWNTGTNHSGSYLAVFDAQSGTYKSQIVVTIKISQQYELIMAAGANGSVSPPAGDHYYDPGTQVQISATPNQGYYFSGWTGSYTGTQNPYTITMDSDKTMTASFTATPPAQYTVSLSASPTAGGTVSQSGSGTYNSGDSVTVTATPNSGYTFTNWTEGAGVTPVSSSNPYQFNITGTRNLVANFSGGPPPPAGEALVWNQRYQFMLNAGTQRVFIATVGANVAGFKVNILGTCNETDATFTWTFPDGRVFPDPTKPWTGEPHIYGTAGAGNMSLTGTAGGWVANIADQYIPQGQHVLTIKATSTSSMVMTAD